jgi:hypothetical protein
VNSLAPHSKERDPSLKPRCARPRSTIIKGLALIVMYVTGSSGWSAGVSSPQQDNPRQVKVVFRKIPAGDTAFRLGMEALQDALKQQGWQVVTSGDAMSGTHSIRVSGTGEFHNDRLAQNQAFAIEPIPEGLEVTSPGIGLVYGLFLLAECIRRDGLDWSMRRKETPAFAERIFSYQGTLLDLPDEGLYFRQPPFVNEALLRQQVNEAKASMRRLLAYKFNTICFLNLNVEDYVNYDLYRNGRMIYPPDSLHRIRAQLFCRAVSELANYAHQLHMQFFLQVYEFSLPDHLDGRQLSDESSQTWELVDAKFRELLERTTLDGVIVTLTEPSPRLAYRGVTLWKTQEGAGRMAAHYYHTIVTEMHRRLIVRLWWVADTPEDFRKVLAGAPEPGIMFDTKNTYGDFFLSVGENPLIPNGAAKRRPFSATFDVFRQFDGWGELLFYPTFWAERFRSAKANGVMAVNAWGPWEAGCIFPGIWVGKYNHYDFLQNGFRPALATLYLFSRLAWNPRESVDDIAADWAAENFGRPNAVLLKKALLLSHELWMKSYLGVDDQGVFKWTMIFQPADASRNDFFKAHALGEVQESNRLALALASQVHDLVYSLQPTAAPHPDTVREFQRAADLTLLYFQTFTTWRELMWRSYEWDEGNHTSENHTTLLRLAGDLEGLLPAWHQFPREAKDWFIFQFDPDMNTAPTWLKRTSVMDTLAEVRRKVAGND